MSALRVYAVGAALLAVTACSGDDGLDDGPRTQGTPTAPVASQPSITTLPTPSAPATPAPRRIGGVTLGAYADDQAVQGFALFVEARVAALKRRDLRYAPMLRLSTPNRHPVDRDLINQMIADDLVFEGTVRYVVIGAATTGDRARIRACQRDDASWFRSRATGKKSATRPVWTAHDVRVVRTGGTWKVDAVMAAKFSCAEAR